MKELSKFEMANVKRTNKSVSLLNRKKERLEAQIAKLQGELDELDKLVDLYETPIKEISGGFTSTEILSGAVQNDNYEESEEAEEIGVSESSEEVLGENSTSVLQEGEEVLEVAKSPEIKIPSLW